MTELAILGGPAHRTAPWPDWPVIGTKERSLIEEVMTSGRWSYEGPMEREFTEKFTQYHGTRYGFCVSNGTVSLELALRAAGIAPGDEVIVPALTWVATASSVLAVGAIPVFVDIDGDTYQIDPEQFESAITTRTRAVIPVHLYCRIVDVDAVCEIARNHGLVMIEDCAQGHGASWKGRRVGSFGDIGAFSFQASKTLTCGEGGFIATDDERLAERIYGLKNVGRAWQNRRRRYVVGRNHRITEFQAAVLLGQFERLEEQLDRRSQNMAFLDAKLAEIEGVNPLVMDTRIDRPPAFAYVFRYEADAFSGIPVEVFRAALNSEGIPADPTYGPVYKTQLWGPDTHEQWRVESCELADRVDTEAVVIQQKILLGDESDMADIVGAIAKIQRESWQLVGVDVESSEPASVAAPRY